MNQRSRSTFSSSGSVVSVKLLARRLTILAASIAVVIGWVEQPACAEETSTGNLQIKLLPATSDAPARVAVERLNESQLDALGTIALDQARLQQVLSVFVVGEESVPVLGRRQVERKRLIFQPRYPLSKSVAYRAVLDLKAIPGFDRGAHETAKLAETLRLESNPSTQPPAVVEAIYPSGDELPENLLRFYIRFSQSMGRGDNYRHIRLLDAEGETIPFPFLELGQELWDPEQQRFTLLLDPGRVKRELQPNKEVGSPLVEGRRYTLEISDRWTDAAGRKLARPFRKEFRVAAPDMTQPDPPAWRLAPPSAGTHKPLVVDLQEPLDHGMLHRSLGVVDASGAEVDGEIRVAKGESQWQFHPQEAWTPGEYELLVDVNLEDRAGNSVERPFEVDVLRPVEKEITTDVERLRFVVAADGSPNDAPPTSATSDATGSDAKAPVEN